MGQWKPILVKSLLDAPSDQQSGVLKWSDLTLLQNEFYDVTEGNVGDIDGSGLTKRLLAVTDDGSGNMETSWQDIYVHPPYAPNQGAYVFSINIGNSASVDLSLLDEDPGTSIDSTYSFNATQIANAVAASDMDMFHQSENWQVNGTYPLPEAASDLASGNVVSMGVMTEFNAALNTNAGGHVTGTTALADNENDSDQAAAYGDGINIGNLPICVGDATDADHNCATEGSNFSGDYNANNYYHKLSVPRLPS